MRCRDIRVGPVLLLSLMGGCATPRYEGPPVPYFREGRFENREPIEPPGAWAVARHILFNRNGNWPNTPLLNTEHPRFDSDHHPIAITFVGHATTLIRIGRVHLLTDPVWSERVGPWGWAGPKRARPPGIPWEQLPKIDAVLISHNHYDHLDLDTLQRLQARDAPQVFVPIGNAKWLQSHGITRAIDVQWWETHNLVQGIKITSTPAQHNSGRGISDQNRTHWSSFWIQAGERSMFFAGDTAYGSHFRAIRDRMGTADAALLPIGAYKPRETVRRYHLDPADAVQAFQDLGARTAIGIHFGLFQLTGEDFDEPPRELAKERENAGLRPDQFLVLDVGASWTP